MVKDRYVPKSGDVVWVDLEPTLGHEQKGRHPAVILSPQTYNEKSGLALTCPVTSKVKGYPFEIKLDSEKVSGAIVSDQVRSLAWEDRHVEYITTLSDKTLERVKKKLLALINS